jgi:hypothetical protein
MKTLHEAVNQIKYMVNLDHLKNPSVNPYMEKVSDPTA